MAFNRSLDAPPGLLPNDTFLTNITSFIGDVDHDIISKYQRNRNIEEPAFSLLIAAYCVLIIVGAAGNSLVVCVVVRKRTMRTARNMFIVNLAVSDMLLCLITMPFTLMEILTKYWPLGRLAFFCKIIGTLQATSIYVSSISNTAIALDRYQVIVYPTRENLQKVGAVVILGCIWLASLVLASPLFIWRTLNHYEINLPDIEYIAYCLEDWPLEHGRVYYSIFSLVFQYVLPFITVTIAYSRICRKLRYRYVNSSIGKGKPTVGGAAGGSSGSSRRKAKGDRRMKRTNTLLVCTALIFCISWLPLNIFNIVMDLWNPVIKNSESMLITYAVMHMMGMSSACSNPLLYGWLNDNFRKEFQEILTLLCPCVPVQAMRERVGSLKSSVSRRRRRRHKSTSGSSGASGLPAGGGGGAGGGNAGAGGAGGGPGGGPQRGHPYGALPDALMGDEATSGEGGDREETVVAISGWRRGTETLTTTTNGTGMLQQDTEMTSLTRA